MDEWKKPMPGNSKLFKAIRIYYDDGREEMIMPNDGQHVLLMTWAEVEHSQSEQPGMLLAHTETVIASKMINRLLHKFPTIWINIQKLWMWQDVQDDFNARLRAKFSGKTKNWQ